MELDYVKLKDIKPALSLYVRKATSLLKQNPVPDDKAVHDIRVLMKKSRAVMKLISSQTDEESFKREYDSFREVGQIMCSWRETSVHRRTLKQLRKDNESIFSMLTGNAKLESLMKKPDLLTEPPPDVRNDIERIEELLNKAGYRIRFQSLTSIDPKILLQELDKTFSIVAHKYLVARNNPKAQNLHALRKRTKDFLYQLYFFRPLNPSVIKSLEKKLDTMTQNLGKYNDLAQLITELDYKYPTNSVSTTMDELAIVIREEQDRYLSKVWPIAYKIFCPGQKLVNILGFKLLII